MATYEEIYGKRVDVIDADPTLNSTYEGQVWYISATGTLRTVVSFAAWSSATPLTTARFNSGGCGTQTANLIFGGSPPVTTATEEYNGSGWSAGGALGTARNGVMGAGTQTTGLSSGGLSSDGSTYIGNVEEYNGSTWSEENNLTTGRGYAFTGGAQTAAWIAGGRKGPPHSNVTDTEEYDGTNWTAGGALGSGGYSSSSSGPLTAGWVAGGNPTSGSAGFQKLIQFYDGTSWTNGPDAPAIFGNATGSGTQTTALCYAMEPPGPGSTATYLYDGSSFSVSPATLGTGRRSASLAQGPSGTAAILAGGRNTPAQSLTEEYNLGVNTITAAAWAAGGNMNTARQKAGGTLSSGSTQSAGMAFGGQIGTATSALNLEYDGTSFSESGDLNTARRYHYGAGSQTAALCGPNELPVFA